MNTLPGMIDDAPESKPSPIVKGERKPRPGIHEPPLLGASPFERVAAARSLVDVVAEFGEGLADVHEVFRCVRGCLYALDGDEVLRVARGLVNVFKASLHQIPKGERDGGDAGEGYDSE